VSVNSLHNTIKSETACKLWLMKYTITSVHCVPKKEATKLLAIILSNLSRFSKFFHCCKGDEISNKTALCFPPYLKYVPALPWESWIVQIYCKLQQKNQKASRIWQKCNICCHTVNLRQAYCFLQHMLEVSAIHLHACTKTHHSSIALSMMIWSTLCHTCCKCCFSSSVLCARDW